MKPLKYSLEGNFKYYFASIFIFIAFTFLIAEIAIRLLTFSNGLGIGSANERWNSKYWTPINQLGYRDYAIEIADSRPSVIFLGDSATAGNGIKFEETFYYSVRKSLDENFRAINISRGGASTGQEKYNLSELITKINPNIDTLIWQVHPNDIEDYVRFPKLKRNILRRALSRVSDLYSFFDILFVSNIWSKGYVEALYLGHRDENIMKKHLVDINDITSSLKNNNSKIIFLAIPFLGNKDSLERSEVYISKLRENFINNCKYNDYFIDITPISEGFNDHDRVVSFLDQHGSPELNSEIATLLTKVISGDYKELDEGVTPCNF